MDFSIITDIAGAIFVLAGCILGGMAVGARVRPVVQRARALGGEHAETDAGATFPTVEQGKRVALRMTLIALGIILLGVLMLTNCFGALEAVIKLLPYFE